MVPDDLVTVIVPCLNEAAFIRAALGSVQQQTHRTLQIVVVDGGSDDGTQEMVTELASHDDRIELLHNERRTIPISLNLALNQARGTWLVRVDAHCTVGPSYVEEAVARLRERPWGGVGGRKDGVGTTPGGRAIAAAMASPFGVGNSVYHHGMQAQEVDHIPFGAYPVDVARSIGGWDERLTANEDYEFDYRIRMSGRTLLFDPELRIDWHCRQTVADLYRQYRRYGRGKFDVARLHPRSLSARHVVAPALIAYLALGGVVGARRPTWLLAMLAPYTAALVAASVSTGRELESTAERVRVPAAFLAMHVGWGVGFWTGMLSATPWATVEAQDCRG